MKRSRQARRASARLRYADDIAQSKGLGSHFNRMLGRDESRWVAMCEGGAIKVHVPRNRSGRCKTVKL